MNPVTAPEPEPATKPAPTQLNTAVHPELYKRLIEVAKLEDRTIVGQLHIILCEALKMPELRGQKPGTSYRQAAYRARLKAKATPKNGKATPKLKRGGTK